MPEQSSATAPHSTGDRLLYLDGWRGWAVTLVIMGHFTPIPGINMGTLGVEMFFVLSGRLMAEILFISQVPLRNFFPRRINRVYPALLVFVLAVFAATQFSEWRVGPKAVLAALTFTSNYSLWIPGLYQHGFFDHLWSLCVEEHSYVILALLVVAARTFGLWPLSAMLIISLIGFINSILSMSVFGLSYFETYWRTDVHISSITISAALHLWISREKFYVPSWIPPTALVMGFLLSTEAFPSPLTYSIGTIFFAMSVCTVDRASALFCKAFTNKTIIVFGLYSYSIYLWQQPFYQMHHVGQISLVTGLALTAVFSSISFHLVENPARKFLNNRLSPSNIFLPVPAKF